MHWLVFFVGSGSAGTAAQGVMNMMHLELLIGVAIIGGLVFAGFWAGFAFGKHGPFYLDPQDSYADPQLGRNYPLSAQTGTFEPLLKHYLGVAQLVFTIAAGSIAFGGGTTQPLPLLVIAAKLLLACCVLYGVLFCGLLIWRYDEYSQDKSSFTLFWYSLVFALGFSSLVCFLLGYLVWAGSLLL